MIAPVVETMGSDTVDSNLLPDVLRMAEDPQWRVRLSVVQTLPIYAKHLGLDLFNSRCARPALMLSWVFSLVTHLATKSLDLVLVSIVCLRTLSGVDPHDAYNAVWIIDSKAFVLV